jgi:hypothetical protein
LAGLRFSTLYQSVQSRLARIAAAKRSCKATNQRTVGSGNISEDQQDMARRAEKQAGAIAVD